MRTLIISMLVLLIALPLFAGGQQEGEAAGGEEGKAKVVEIPMLFRDSGNDANARMNKEIIDRFTEEYAGEYKLDIEWVPGMAEEYRQKLKMLNSAGDLPTVVTNLAQEAAFAEMLMENDRLMDLKPYFDASPEWQQYAFEASVEYNTTDDGKMYTGPIASAPYVGIFYNVEYFEKAGVSDFPTTWDEFWNACEKLQQSNITPISLHTTETGWCTNLMLTTYLARTQEGRDFMDIRYPSDEFTSPVFVDGVKMLEKLYNYTTSDAIGGKYALAANHFSSGDTAMIPNGPWMINSFYDTQYSPEGFADKVKYGRYPNNVMISSQGAEYGWGVSMDHPKEVREGGVEWIKFNWANPEIIKIRIIEVGDRTHKVQLTDEELQQLGPVEQSYQKAVEGVEYTIPWFQAQWDPITQNETVVKNLPAYLYGDITAEEYCEMMKASGKKYLESQQ